LIEASAMARPIVATRVGGIPELVRDGETGLLVEQGNLEALTAALRQLLSNPPRAQQMGEKGRERTLARFSWKRHGDEMIQIYQSVLNSL
jgi:glycosyltransferase involved in cell wall biosynthesis